MKQYKSILVFKADLEYWNIIFNIIAFQYSIIRLCVRLS